MLKTSRRDLLQWFNSLNIPIKKIEDLGTGTPICQLLNLLHPSLNLSYIKSPVSKYEYLKNLKVVQNFFFINKIEVNFPIERIVECKLQDNLEFAQWLYKYYVKINKGKCNNEVCNVGGDGSRENVCSNVNSSINGNVVSNGTVGNVNMINKGTSSINGTVCSNGNVSNVNSSINGNVVSNGNVGNVNSAINNVYIMDNPSNRNSNITNKSTTTAKPNLHSSTTYNPNLYPSTTDKPNLHSSTTANPNIHSSTTNKSTDSTTDLHYNNSSNDTQLIREINRKEIIQNINTSQDTTISNLKTTINTLKQELNTMTELLKQKDVELINYKNKLQQFEDKDIQDVIFELEKNRDFYFLILVDLERYIETVDVDEKVKEGIYEILYRKD